MRIKLLFVSLLLLVSACKTETKKFRVGYMICNSLEETRERFGPLTAHLAETLGIELEPVYLHTADVEEAFEKGEVDFTHTNSLVYIILNKRHSALPLTTDMRGAFGSRSKGLIIAKKGSGIEKLEDLKGKRVAFGPSWAPFAFLAPYNVLIDGGVHPEKDLGYYAIPPGSWKHEKVFYSVLYGAFDAGAVPLLDLEKLGQEGKIAEDDFVVLGSSELGPYCTFAASPKVPAEWVEKFKNALLAVNNESIGEFEGEKLLVLKRALVDGFESATDPEYDILRSWAKKAKMPPYEEY